MKRKIMSKPQILNGVKFRKEKISVYKLHAALSCQREIDDSVVEQIYTDWIDGYYNNPIINFVNGQYRLIGGQHTVAAYIKRIENGLETNVMIECKIAENLTPAQEAAIFKYSEDCRRSQTYDSKLTSYWSFTNVDLTDEDSRKLYDVNAIINKYGYTVKCNKNDNITVECTETLLNLSNDWLDKIFSFLMNVFPNDKSATKAMFIKSVGHFLELFESDIDIKKFSKAVKATKSRKLITAESIIEESKLYPQYKSNTKKQIAYSIAIAYQKRVKSSALPLYKFDMM